MANEKFFLNDVGHILTVRTGVSLTSVNTAILEILKVPDSDISDVSTATWIASISNIGSGEVAYVTQSGDFSIAGIYEATACIWTSPTIQFHGDTFNFEVFSKWL